MSVALEPCPFCGGEQTVTSPDRAFGDTTWSAGCKACGAQVIRDLEPDAIAAWNRRSPSSAKPPLGDSSRDEQALVRELVGALEAVERQTFCECLNDGFGDHETGCFVPIARSALLHAREMEGQTPTGASRAEGEL